MKLSYRGVSYEYNPPQVETTEAQVAGKYRGLDWRFRNMKKPPMLLPTANLTYRGFSYQTAGITESNLVEPTKTPILSIQDQARSRMLNHLRTVKNRQQAMLNRSAEAVGLVAQS